jgi:hypothetical protein
LPQSDLENNAQVADNKDCWMLTLPYLFLTFFWDVDHGGPMPMILETAKSYPLVSSWTQKTSSASTLVCGSCRCWISEVPCQPGLSGSQQCSAWHSMWHFPSMFCAFLSSTRFGWVKRTGKKICKA